MTSKGAGEEPWRESGTEGYWKALSYEDGGGDFEYQSKGKNGQFYTRHTESLYDAAERLNRYENERPDLERMAALALEMRGALSAGVGDAAFLRDWCGRLDDAYKAGRKAGE